MTVDEEAADDAIRYLANFHAVAAITCFIGALVLATPGINDFLQSSASPWLRAAKAPALLVIATALAAAAYGGYQRRPWGWVLALAVYVAALAVAIWLGMQGVWASWSAVPAAAFLVGMLLTKGVRRVYGFTEPSL